MRQDRLLAEHFLYFWIFLCRLALCAVLGRVGGRPNLGGNDHLALVQNCLKLGPNKFSHL